MLGTRSRLSVRNGLGKTIELWDIFPHMRQKCECALLYVPRVLFSSPTHHRRPALAICRCNPKILMSPFRSYHVPDNLFFLLFFHLGRICDIESIHPFHLSELVACGNTLQVGGSTSKPPSAS